MRVFLAFPLPDDLRRKLAAAAALFIPAGFKAVPEENLHLTLAFIGETDSSGAATAAEAAAGAALSQKPIGIRFSGVVAFPRAASARVVAARGIGDGGACAALAARFEAALAELARERGTPFRAPERRHFSAHVTVARASRPARLPGTALQAELDLECELERIAVYQSVLGHGGARYRLMKDFPFSRQQREFFSR